MTPDQAASAQAVAAEWQAGLTIVALAIAIGVPWWQQHRDSQQQKLDRQTQARAMLWIMEAEASAIELFATGITEEQRFYLEGRKRGEISGTKDGSPVVLTTDLLLKCLDRIHLLGPLTARSFLQFLREINKFNSLSSYNQQAAVADSVVRAAVDLKGCVSMSLDLLDRLDDDPRIEQLKEALRTRDNKPGELGLKPKIIKILWWKFQVNPLTNKNSW